MNIWLIKVEDDGGSISKVGIKMEDWDAIIKIGDKRSDYEYVLKIKLKRICCGLNVGYERKRNKGRFQVFWSLSN